jgi:hypothetical protein
MAILITGGAGFIGVQLAREFLKRGEDIVIFDKVISDSLFAEKKVTKIKGDITNWPEVLNVGILKISGRCGFLKMSSDHLYCFKQRCRASLPLLILEVTRVFTLRGAEETRMIS